MKRAGETLVLGAGSAALLLAMTADFVSVVGRHLGWSPQGVVEIVQICIVVAISAALIIATARGAHASVHILTERLPRRLAHGLERASDILGALLLGLLAAGSAWMLADTWPGNERSDVLGLPVAPARIIWTGSLLLAALLFLVSAFDPPPPSETTDSDGA